MKENIPHLFNEYFYGHISWSSLDITKTHCKFLLKANVFQHLWLTLKKVIKTFHTPGVLKKLGLYGNHIVHMSVCVSVHLSIHLSSETRSGVMGVLIIFYYSSVPLSTHIH